MADCPKCGNKIPASKLISLTRFSTSLTCPTCNSRLEWENKGTGSLIGALGGGVGGGLGALLGEMWVFTGDIAYLILIAPLVAGVFFAVLGAISRFTKFKQKSD